MNRAWERVVDRLAAADPGYLRLRVATSAVLGVVIAVAVLGALGWPLGVLLVGAISAMMPAFTVNDRTPGRQAVTLLWAVVVGAVSLTAASLGAAVPPVDNVVFVLLIFVAVYAQRFGPRGVALGSIAFFLFFFAMFLGIRVGQVPSLLLALVVGLTAHALVRFAVLPRRPERELLRVRRAFRARLGAVARAAAGYLAAGGGRRAGRQLRRADARLHECVLLIEDTADALFTAEAASGTADALFTAEPASDTAKAPSSAGEADADERAAGLLRRRAIEVELAAQWLSITTRRTCREELTAAQRDELVTALRRLDALIERDPKELPLISATDEFSRMLVEGSRLGARRRPGDELHRAIAELALADVNAQRIAERDYSAEGDDSPNVPDGPDSPNVSDTPTQPANAVARTANTPTGAVNTPGVVRGGYLRSAVQAVVGGGLAMVGGELVSPQRWYWAVLTVFVVFLGSSTTGATFVKGVRRLAGTLAGIFGGVFAALLVGGNTAATVALILVCVFGMVHTARVAQGVMTFFMTTMLGLLYSLLGTFSYGVFGIRLAETAVGVAAGVLAAVVIVPVRTRSAMLADIADVLADLRTFLDEGADLLAGTRNLSLIELSRTLDRGVERVRGTVEPLTHPINVRGARRDLGWYVLTTLEAIAFRARHVAARAEPGLLAGDDRLPERVERIRRNLDRLLEVVRAPGSAGRAELVPAGDAPPADETDDPRRRAVLSSLGQLDAAVVTLGRAFDVPVAESSDGAHASGIDTAEREVTHPRERGDGG
ncbi:Fusaric acid resistance protein-like [Amycolatopsis arida]|uniref:Fusaric acid resistance protein-like n=1 Tax=Amycolatopsis arida TaxID=587909 RepID=A0A1I5ZE73_9PSEU|nr:FUSC family protein [Amycolatopsis arida]TDX89568.1 fusaric acid resistance family protein [Amycolatopsis arida]SFQ54703.1 Fusaric acid resistance protein-like [Amycolatopsis arida]